MSRTSSHRLEESLVVTHSPKAVVLEPSNVKRVVCDNYPDTKLSYAQLSRLAASHPPPQKWYDEDIPAPEK